MLTALIYGILGFCLIADHHDLPVLNAIKEITKPAARTHEEHREIILTLHRVYLYIHRIW